MLNKIADRLLKVDSIVTILLTIVVCILAIRGQFDIKDVFFVIITFYFTKKSDTGAKLYPQESKASKEADFDELMSCWGDRAPEKSQQSGLFGKEEQPPTGAKLYPQESKASKEADCDESGGK